MSHEPITIPQHIAIIMDGNRRWAKAHHMPVLAGHRRVANDVLEPIVERAAKIGIRYLTFWAFSTENWRREPAEVQGIMKIFRSAITAFGEKMHKKGIRIRVIGDLDKFDSDIRDSVGELVEKTKQNTVITVVFALNYGGRDEIIRAMRNIPAGAARISTENFSDYLDTQGIPDPELIIRTGGEQRLSGFLLWQSQYSELYFPAWYMPEFTPARLDEAVGEYARRQRRFGS
jgi:undecaprenyl diphosphate synthase